MEERCETGSWMDPTGQHVVYVCVDGTLSLSQRVLLVSPELLAELDLPALM